MVLSVMIRLKDNHQDNFLDKFLDNFLDSSHIQFKPIYLQIIDSIQELMVFKRNILIPLEPMATSRHLDQLKAVSYHFALTATSSHSEPELKLSLFTMFTIYSVFKLIFVKKQMFRDYNSYSNQWRDTTIDRSIDTTVLVKEVFQWIEGIQWRV